MNIDWNTTFAAIYRSRSNCLRAVQRIDPVGLNDLVGIDEQVRLLETNTRRFLDGMPANNVLLWGPRGTGKSSLIKALLNAYSEQGLRIIEVDKDDLVLLPEIVDEIRDLTQFHFIVFCDDLSFEEGERTYKALKSALDGSIELPPENVLVYATSNRRHLVPEYMEENLRATYKGGQIHHDEAVEEKISLSERFGLWVSFYPVDRQGYLAIVDSLFPDWSGDRSVLHEAAWAFALRRGSHNGRIAQQFFRHFAVS
ncbi:MAG: ATPase [Deltaproteobacteria bacterium]|nr:MAG: ATPase [Deltaproteobacteria bacterium]